MLCRIIHADVYRNLLILLIKLYNMFYIHSMRHSKVFLNQCFVSMTMCLRVKYDLLYTELEVFVRLMKDDCDIHGPITRYKNFLFYPNARI